jgi:hypothetical protein
MKKIILVIVFIFNLLTTSAYIILKYLGYAIITKADFTLLLIYDIITLVIFGELLQEEDKNRKEKD